MANLTSANTQINFRYLQNIDSLNESQLKTHGYYLGYPCVHHHRIRDVEHHWCYKCVLKIKSNLCGFNANFIHPYYNSKYVSLWNKVEIGHFEDCWPISLPGVKGPKRINFPSYRSFYTGRASENVSPRKLIYQCAWGDIGDLTVSKLCGNPWCANPLHLISSWNVGVAPERIHPFILELKPEQIMLFHQAKLAGKEQELLERYYKQTIMHPLCVPGYTDN